MEDSNILWKKAQEYEKNHNYREATEAYLKAARIDLKNGNKKDALLEFTKAGIYLYNIGVLDGALKYFKEALEIDNQLGDLIGKSAILSNIGGILHDRGDLDGALKHYKEALKIDDQLGNIKLKAVDLNNIGLIIKDRGDLDGALKYYEEALDLVQKQIKGKELDFKAGQIPCPNPNCQNNIQIKLMGELAAFIQTCPICSVQFSIWMVDPNSSKYIINVFSEEILKKGRVVSGNVNLREKAGIETQTTISEWLHDGAIITSNTANCFKQKGDLLNACNYYFQAASIYMGLGLLEASENNFRILESLFPDISTKDREKFSHDVALLRKQTSEILRSRDFTYIFISCPNCGIEHQIRAGITIVAYEFCSKCRTKFSVFYNEETQEFYTNILEKPKLKTVSQPEQKETDFVKFCARCGLNIGIIAKYCIRCGLEILRA